MSRAKVLAVLIGFEQCFNRLLIGFPYPAKQVLHTQQKSVACEGFWGAGGVSRDPPRPTRRGGWIWTGSPGPPTITVREGFIRVLAMF